MKKITKIQLPDGWIKKDNRTVIHTSGAEITLKLPRLDYQYNEKKFLIRINNDWIYNYQVNGFGQWIAEFNTLLEAINFVNSKLKKG